ncbi:hypothetical protein Bca52824_058685 [Brassica carinata]|uniref:Uncharacterized protein n=1 Tax=Brassica carinata TaxID=52824 RepID=A0A8X7QWR5_BRACI|nr:hypothetical protein Bca52824_058685 [Brassica carinata]
MSQEDDVDVTPLSHNPFSYPQGTLKQSQFRSLVVKAASVVAPKLWPDEKKNIALDWSTNHLLYKYAGTEVEFNDVKHLILKEDDIGLS